MNLLFCIYITAMEIFHKGYFILFKFVNRLSSLQNVLELLKNKIEQLRLKLKGTTSGTSTWRPLKGSKLWSVKGTIPRERFMKLQTMTMLKTSKKFFYVYSMYFSLFLYILCISLFFFSIFYVFLCFYIFCISL